MSLRAQIRRCQAQLDWLDTRGELRLCEHQLKLLEYKEIAAARLAANPRSEKARRFGAMLGIALPPLPEPVVRPPPPAPAPAVVRPAPPPAPPPPARDERFRDSSFADTTFANVVRTPPASWPPPPPPVEWETHDIPEHMQIRPTQWRQRNASDVDDWDDNDRPGYGQCLTEYDPLAGHDDDS